MPCWYFRGMYRDRAGVRAADRIERGFDLRQLRSGTRVTAVGTLALQGCHRGWPASSAWGSRCGRSIGRRRGWSRDAASKGNSSISRAAHDLKVDGIRADVIYAHRVKAKELRCGQVILASDDELPPAGTHDISAGVVSASELHVHDVEAGFIEAATLYAHELKLK